MCIRDRTVTNDLEKQVEIGTTAKDGQTGTNEGIPAKQVTIIDTVSYYNLIPGKEYTCLLYTSRCV